MTTTPTADAETIEGRCAKLRDWINQHPIGTRGATTMYGIASDAIAELASLRERLRQSALDYLALDGQATDALSRALALQSKLADAKVALEPFGNYYGPHYPDTDDKGVPLPGEDGVGWIYLTVGDFRRARSTLARIEADHVE